MTQGYRKVPGDICTGGLDLSPVQYSCSITGAVTSFFSLKGIFYLGVFGALIYFGWPIIEAILILLPIPDPEELKRKMKSGLDVAKTYGNAALDKVKGGSGADKPLGGY